MDEEDDSADVFEIFDYTIASPWEQLIASAESAIRSSPLTSTHPDGPIEHTLEYQSRRYRLLIHLPSSDDNAATVPDSIFCRRSFLSHQQPHPLSRRFGVHKFVTLADADEDIIEADEANMLLSTILIALRNCQCTVPCFVSAHSPARRAFYGFLGDEELMVRFDCDSTNSIPPSTRHLTGIVDMFSTKMQLPSAAVCQVLISCRFCYTLTWELLPAGLDRLELWVGWPSFQNGQLTDNPVYTDLKPEHAPEWHLTLGGGGEYPRPITERLTTMVNAMWQIEPSSSTSDSPHKPPQMMKEWPLPPTNHQPLKGCDGLRSSPGGTAFDQLISTLLDSAPSAVEAVWRSWLNSLRNRWEARAAIVSGTDLLANDAQSLGADHRWCLAYQKLQLLDVCCSLLKNKPTSDGPVHEDCQSPNDQFEDFNDTDELPPADWSVDNSVSPTSSHAASHAAAAIGALGASHALEGVMLLSDASQQVFVPVTRPMVILPEDLLMIEQELLLQTENQSDRAAHQSEGLQSDMQCFLAANPGAQLADFVRWHSPRDWIEGPQGGQLSTRMADEDNLWHQLWGGVEPVPAAEQPAVIDALKYGEAVMDWFEELSGPELVEQLFHTATAASCQQLIQKAQVAPLAVLQEGINALSAAAVVEDWMSACCDRLGELEIMAAEASALQQLWPGLSRLMSALVANRAVTGMTDDERAAVGPVFFAQSDKQQGAAAEGSSSSGDTKSAIRDPDIREWLLLSAETFEAAQEQAHSPQGARQQGRMWLANSSEGTCSIATATVTDLSIPP